MGTRVDVGIGPEGGLGIEGTGGDGEAILNSV